MGREENIPRAYGGTVGEDEDHCEKSRGSLAFELSLKNTVLACVTVSKTIRITVVARDEDQQPWPN